MKEISIKDIQINRENPRHNPTLFEEEAIKLLCLKNQKMIDLCDSILEKSFYPQSIISVVEDGDRYIAIDGNRRLCALKLLNGFVSPPKGKKYTKLRNYLEDKSLDYQLVYCAIYQDEADAADYILEVHTSGSDVEKWNQIQQYKYKKRFSKKTIVGYEILINNYEHPENISNPSNIMRVFGNEEVRKLLGINQDGSLIDVKMLDYVKSIVKDIDEKKEDSRSLNSTNQIVDFVTRKLNPNLNQAEKKEEKGKSSSENKTETDPKNEKPKKNNQRKRKQYYDDLTILPRDCNFLSDSSKLNKIIEELTTLKIDDYIYSSVILYRSFLQISLKYYSTKSTWNGFDVHNLEGSLNSFNNSVFSPMGLDSNTGVHSQISKVLNKKGKFIQIINGYTHDLDTEFNKTLFLDFKRTFTPLLNHIYEESQREKNKAGHGN